MNGKTVQIAVDIILVMLQIYIFYFQVCYSADIKFHNI